MKVLLNSILFGALLAPLSAHAHPGHEGVSHALLHWFDGVDPVWGGIIGGMVMIVGAWWFWRAPT